MDPIIIRVNISDKSEIQDIKDKVKSFSEDNTVTTSKGLDGSFSAIIEMLCILPIALPAALEFVKSLLRDKGKITVIRVGEWEVENPSEEMEKLFEERLRKEIADS